MTRLLAWLPLPVAILVTTSLGAVLGYASSVVYVLGLSAIAMGLAAGATVSVVSLMGGGGVVRGAQFHVVVAVLAGWLVGQIAEDQAFQATWREDYAAARQAAAGVDPSAGVGADEQVFYVDGSDEALEAEVDRVVGTSGVAGRWLFRADAGLRLIGPASGGRGLPVGRIGVMVWVFVEIWLAIFIARALLARVRVAVAEREVVEAPSHES